jgi:hypothetical protein
MGAKQYRYVRLTSGLLEIGIGRVLSIARLSVDTLDNIKHAQSTPILWINISFET